MSRQLRTHAPRPPRSPRALGQPTSKQRRVLELREWLRRQAADLRGVPDYVVAWSEVSPHPSWSRSRLTPQQAAEAVEAATRDQQLDVRVTRDALGRVRCIEVIPRG